MMIKIIKSLIEAFKLSRVFNAQMKIFGAIKPKQKLFKVKLTEKQISLLYCCARYGIEDTKSLIEIINNKIIKSNTRIKPGDLVMVMEFNTIRFLIVKNIYRNELHFDYNFCYRKNECFKIKEPLSSAIIKYICLNRTREFS